MDDDGVLHTKIFAFVAASKSILSTPTPALPIIFNDGDEEMTFDVILVAERITTAS